MALARVIGLWETRRDTIDLPRPLFAFVCKRCLSHVIEPGLLFANRQDELASRILPVQLRVEMLAEDS